MADGISTSLGGLQDAAKRAQQAAQNIARQNTDRAAKADRDAAQNLVDLKQSQLDYEANAKALRAQQDNEKRLLDILA